jgi:hypothetical protein
MKSLITYIKECDFTTPMNTIGMGNPLFSTDIGVGTEPITLNKPRKIKKLKKQKPAKNNI